LLFDDEYEDEDSEGDEGHDALPGDTSEDASTSWGYGFCGTDQGGILPQNRVDGDAEDAILAVPRDGWGGVDPAGYGRMSRELMEWVCDEMDTPASARWKQRSTPLQVMFRPSKRNFLYQAAAKDHNGAAGRPRLLSGSRPSL
jgi:hypothetical protein